jgi:Flp pilus assembly protein TadG
MVRQDRGQAQRPAAAAVELALLLPLLAFLMVIAIDFGRLFYFSLTVMNCARNGAVYGCDPTTAMNSPYTSVQDAALSDAPNLSPQPTVSSQIVADSDGSHIEVTVTYQFSTITSYPGVPSSLNLARTVKMRMVPNVPNFGP